MDPPGLTCFLDEQFIEVLKTKAEILQFCIRRRDLFKLIRGIGSSRSNINRLLKIDRIRSKLKFFQRINLRLKSLRMA